MAIDKIKALKFENPASGGTQLDMFPTETNPAQDYLAAKGVSFENLDTASIRGDSGVITLTTNGVDRTVTDTAGLQTHTGQFKLVDGTQGVTKVLTSDANGLASWQQTMTANATEVSATATATVNSSTDALITGMTFTPSVTGTYLILFSCDINSGTAGAAISVSYYFNGAQAANSLRKIIPFAGGTLTTGSARACVSINDINACTAGQAVEVRWSISSGSATTASRTLDVIRLF